MKTSLQNSPKTKIAVIGDFLLDAYTMGKVFRISPEAPVAVVHVEREEKKAGGAGNVVLNLLSLGLEVLPIGRIGDDITSDALSSALAREGVSLNALFLEKGYITPLKNRIVAENQQIVRVDHETLTPLSLPLEKRLIKSLPSLLEGVSLLAVSDYGKGFVSEALLKALVDYSHATHTPLLVDPKGSDFVKYKGCTLLKPNLKEAYEASNSSSKASLDEVARHLFTLTDAEALLITRAGDGMTLFEKSQGRTDFPSSVREVKDVTGAGDTALAALCLGLSQKLTLQESVRLSNIAAGLSVEHFGCARISLKDLQASLVK